MNDGDGPDPAAIGRLVALYGEGKYGEAAAAAQALVERHPRHGFAWKVLGAALLQLGRTGEAIAPMQAAASLSPGDAQAQSNLGNALRLLGRLDEAAAACRLALQVDPNSAGAHINLGNVLREERRLDGAETCYRQALLLAPDSAEAHGNLGVVLVDQGRLAEAEASYRRALAIDPHDAEAHNNLGVALKEMGSLAAAEDSLRCALRIDPRRAWAHANLGAVLGRAGRLAEAEACYRQALRLEPGNAEMRYELANVLAESGQRDAAANEYRSCLTMDADDGLGARHMLAGLELAPMPARTSAAKLDRLYARRASSWDRGTNYFGHELVARTLVALTPQAPRLAILDAGCGTGLVGERLRHLAARLDGVDLSADMLARAREKSLYDDLVQGDLVALMRDRPEAYDAIACAATLIHFGDLAPVFAAALGSLRARGLFVFTLFSAADDDAAPGIAPDRELAAGGCYAHGPRYVSRVAAAAGFAVERLDREIHEYSKRRSPIAGLVVALRRPL